MQALPMLLILNKLLYSFLQGPSKYTIMQCKAPSKLVFLWTAPRSCSSAFERSIMTLANTCLMSEPFSQSYYFGPERESRRFETQEVDPSSSYEAVARVILQQSASDNVDLVFIKDMAYSLRGR